MRFRNNFALGRLISNIKIYPESTFNCATSAVTIVNFGKEMLSLWAGEFGDPLKQKYNNNLHKNKSVKNRNIQKELCFVHH